ncbi:MAG: TldD/PmbA family protein [Dehalococcoidales bacterium]|nr:TldD/PmbA family protein [Dehalococcoidales bacterium]
MEEILELARRSAEEAEVFSVSTEETPIQFQANRLKAIESKQTSSVSLRIIKNGRLGYAAASGEIDPRKLVDIAVETSQFGMPARFSFPSYTSFPEVRIADDEVEAVPVSEMIELGHKMIDPVVSSTPGIMCDAGVSRETISMKLLNSRGGRAEYRKTAFGIGVGGTLIRDTDMLFVGDGQESCHPLRDTGAVTAVVLRQLELAKNIASAPNRELPVIFTPDGVASVFVPALMAAFNGKIVLEGASPLGKRLGEKVFDGRLSLFDDPTVEFAPRSRPCDDEGVPSLRNALIEEGVVRRFLYDLQTAGQAGTDSTGNGSRGRGGLVAPSSSALIFNTGQTSFEEMVADIREGLVIEQLMGAEQGNILGGDFSGNVLLGYKIENGRITGRVKDTMVSGNLYQALKDIAALGDEARWVGSSLFTPHIYCRSLAVASK